jgi:hypothetical protein
MIPLGDLARAAIAGAVLDDCFSLPPDASQRDPAAKAG